MKTNYTISSFIWTDQLEWPNYIKTYLHFFVTICKHALHTCTILLTPDCTAVLEYGENQTIYGIRFVDECRQIINALNVSMNIFHA